jgi:hypothetical protein
MIDGLPSASRSEALTGASSQVPPETSFPYMHTSERHLYPMSHLIKVYLLAAE